MRFFSRTPRIDFMGVRKPAAAVTVLLTVLAIVAIVVRGFNFGIDFTGGVLVEVGYAKPVALDDVRQELHRAGFAEASAQSFGSDRVVLVRLPPLPPKEVASGAQFGGRIATALGGQASGVEIRRVEFVGPQVGKDLTESGTLAALAAIVMIGVYIMFRFQWKYSLAAIIALAHDTILTLGLLAALHVSFDLTVLASLLAMMGYSLNDTIVIFDRVRENFIESREDDPLQVVNDATNQTLARSIITHVTTFLSMLALFFFGGDSVHGFALTMLAGVVFGTYSSVFVAGAVAVALGAKREDLLPKAEAEFDGVEQDYARR